METLKSHFKALDILSKPDSMIILIKAAGGFKGSNQVSVDLGLTKKRYYTALEELIAFGLVGKKAMDYSLTIEGKLVMGISLTLIKLMGSKANKDIELLGELLNVERFNSDAKEVLGFLRKVRES